MFFIDGTVEGTNILKYATANDSFTYYGNGCPNTWDDSKPGHGGSSEACSTRIVSTFDGENQKNGTYFTFNAAASGSGGTSLATNNANSPDTFCPLGWQMPYGGTGGDYYNKSRSWKYLLSIYNITIGADLGGGPAVMSYPFDIIPSGALNIANGYLLEAHENGVSGSANHWLSTMTNRQNSDKLQVWWNTVDIRYFFKSYGLAVRCDCRISILNQVVNSIILKI